LAVTAIAWVIFTQIAASGLGGYLAGRLRGRWTRLRDHEVYFRDTAHGLLAWGLSTLIMAALMGATLGGVVNQSTRVAGAAATVAAAAMGDNSRDDSGYWIDALLRSDSAPAGASLPAPVVDPATDATMRAQAGRILVRALQTGSLPNDDAAQLALIVSQRTGMPLADAQRRVTETHARARKAIDDTALQARRTADEARKASAYTALWMVIALMAGAFVSAWLATFGGRQRDNAFVAV
jgi:MFS family permease